MQKEGVKGKVNNKGGKKRHIENFYSYLNLCVINASVYVYIQMYIYIHLHVYMHMWGETD